MAMWPRRSGINGRVRRSSAGQRESLTSWLAHRPFFLASATAASGSTVRVAKRMSP